MEDVIKLPEHAKNLLIGVLAVYLAGLFILSIIATRKVATEEDYLVAGRKLSLFLAWGTIIATWFGAAAMTGSAEAARDDGLLGVILDPFACAGTLVLAGMFFARPLWNMKLLTMGDFFRRKFGAKSEVLAAFIQVPSYFGWIAAQYLALARVQLVYFGIPEWLGILIGAGITLSYTMVGGMWSVTLTDTAQIVLALTGLVCLGYATFSSYGEGSWLTGVDRLWDNADPNHLAIIPVAALAPVLAYTGNWVTGLFGNLPGQDLQQRVFAAKSARTAQWACILAGIAYLAFGMLPVALGILSNLTDPGEGKGILQLLAGKYLTPTMAVIFTVSFVSIVVSTATSAVLAPATILSHNLLGRLKLFQGHGLLLDRACVLLISLGGITLAFTGKKIMGLLELSLSIALVALFVPLLTGLYGRPRGQLPAILATSFGFVVYMFRFLFEEVVVKAPEGFDEYSEYIASAFSPERVGTFASGVMYAFAVVPPELLGLAFSFAGYFLGQSLLARQGHTHAAHIAALEQAHGPGSTSHHG